MRKGWVPLLDGPWYSLPNTLHTHTGTKSAALVKSVKFDLHRVEFHDLTEVHLGGKQVLATTTP